VVPPGSFTSGRGTGSRTGTSTADPMPVCSTPDDRTTLGLFDMTGNASRWTPDCDHTDCNGAPDPSFDDEVQIPASARPARHATIHTARALGRSRP